MTNHGIGADTTSVSDANSLLRFLPSFVPLVPIPPEARPNEGTTSHHHARMQGIIDTGDYPGGDHPRPRNLQYKSIDDAHETEYGQTEHHRREQRTHHPSPLYWFLT